MLLNAASRPYPSAVAFRNSLLAKQKPTTFRLLWSTSYGPLFCEHELPYEFQPAFFGTTQEFLTVDTPA
jgi:hypothetical protein